MVVLTLNENFLLYLYYKIDGAYEAALLLFRRHSPTYSKENILSKARRIVFESICNTVRADPNITLLMIQ